LSSEVLYQATVYTGADYLADCVSGGEQHSFVEVEQGLTSHQTHYRSYRGQVFTGQITQPTASTHCRKIGRKD